MGTTPRLETLNFGPELFKRFTGCQTFTLESGFIVGDLVGLVDHGFIADRACLWDERLEGNEIAIIARTYCSKKDIKKHRPGLKIVKLPPHFMGPGDPKDSTPIALVITGKSKESEMLINACITLPGYLFTYTISLEMQSKFCMSICDFTPPRVKLIKRGCCKGGC